MILILTPADMTPVQPLTPELALKAGVPFVPGQTAIVLTPAAQAASKLAETVWFRDANGHVRVAKSCTGIPNGTPVTLINAAELFGIKVQIDP